MSPVVGHPRILLVEDDDDIRDAVEDALKRRGFATLAVEDGHDALEYLRRAEVKPSLILLDLTMPRMSGWEFMQAQSQDAALAGIPVVVLSAVGNLEQQAPAIPWAGILTKPVSLERLIETVQKFC